MKKILKNMTEVRYSFWTILILICFTITLRISLDTRSIISILIMVYNAFVLYMSVDFDFKNKKKEMVDFAIFSYVTLSDEEWIDDEEN